LGDGQGRHLMTFRRGIPIDLLVPHETLMVLSRSYSRLAQVSVQVMGPDCAPSSDPVSVQKESAFCEEFIWRPVQGRAECYDCNLRAAREIRKKGGGIMSYPCHCLFTDIVAPIIAGKGRVHGYVFGGQVRTRSVTRRTLLKLARAKVREEQTEERLNTFVDEWLKVPFLSRKELAHAKSCLVRLAECLAVLASQTSPFTHGEIVPRTLEHVVQAFAEGKFQTREMAWKWALCLGEPGAAATIYEAVGRDKEGVSEFHSVLRHRTYTRFEDPVEKRLKPQHHVWRVAS